MTKPSFESNLKIGSNKFEIKLKGPIAENTELIIDCAELQGKFKTKVRGMLIEKRRQKDNSG
ncbi:MAG: hypothetical protein K9K32_05900 [Halanaerobiales bacterium]|nr:hypothetical protein [Halanaerobiales bacterium]